MGPEPVPFIPKYDVWVRKDGRRRLIVQPQLDCNWFQAMENSVDPSHLQILHQSLIARNPITNQTRGLTDTVAKFEFIEVPYGIIKKRTYKTGAVDQHPLIFPNILRQANATQIRVPMDDTHTKIFFVRFDPSEDGSIVEEKGDPSVEYVKPYKNPPDALHPFTRFDISKEVQAQDHMAWETLGPISDRTDERLGTADGGIVILREMMFKEIEKVQKGLDPKGVIRDPAQDKMIDTMLGESLRGPETRGELREMPKVA